MPLAKAEAKERYKSIEFWYRRKYNLPKTDPRFLDATVDEMLADYYAHTFFDDPKAAEVIEDDDFDPDKVADLIGASDPGDWVDLK